jgi:hypothetical protein
MSKNFTFFITIKTTVFLAGFLLLAAAWFALLLSNPIGWGLLILLGILGTIGAAVLATIPYHVVNHFLPTNPDNADIAAEADADAEKGFFEKALYKIGSVIAGVVAGIGALLVIGTPLAAAFFIGGLISGAVTFTAPVWAPVVAFVAGMAAGIGGIFAGGFIYEAQASISRGVGYVEQKVTNVVTNIANSLRSVATSLSSSLSSLWSSVSHFWSSSASSAATPARVPAPVPRTSLQPTSDNNVSRVQRADVEPAVTAVAGLQSSVPTRSVTSGTEGFLSSVFSFFSSRSAISLRSSVVELPSVVADQSGPRA